MPDEQVILEITTGKTKEIQFANYDGAIEAILPYAKSSPAGLLVEALVKMCRSQIEEHGVDPETKISKVRASRS